MERPIPLRLPIEERQALATLAVLEYRDVNDQAVALIAEGLRRRGPRMEHLCSMRGVYTRGLGRARVVAAGPTFAPADNPLA